MERDPNMTTYEPNEQRYEGAKYRRCGKSGLALPAISLGFWQNFGGVNVFETCRAVVRRAFDRGVTHFDVANMYGPPNGSAEENLGTILKKRLRPASARRVVNLHKGGIRNVVQDRTASAPQKSTSSHLWTRAYDGCVWTTWTFSTRTVPGLRSQWKRQCRPWPNS